MTQPTIAVGLKGVLMHSEAWDGAHKAWFEKYAQELGDENILKWVGREDYFRGVNEIMQRAMPNATEEERTVRARKEYHELLQTQANKELRTEIVSVLAQAATHARIIVVTSTEESVAKQLLTHIPQGIIHATYGSLPEEKDEKKVVFERMLANEEKPIAYIGSGRQETKTICSQHNITTIDASDISAQELRAALNQALGLE